MAAEPAPGEEAAARELVRYLRKLGGAPVELHRGEPGGAPVRILVGARARQEIAGLPVHEVRDDGFVLEAAPERVALAVSAFFHRRGGVACLDHGHVLPYLVPPAEYYDSHPEYFARQEDGRLFERMPKAYQMHLCTSHPEVVTWSCVESSRG